MQAEHEGHQREQHVVIRVLNGTVREISPTLWVIFALSLAMLVI